MKKMIIQIKRVVAIVFLLMITTGYSADIPGTNGVPDLTKGGVLKRINLRWAGPLGILCGSWRPRGQKIEDVRQLQVLAIEKGSPADGILKIDDVILGADGTGAEKVPLFKGAEWSMIPIADAITEAEAHDPALLKLLIWRPSSAKASAGKKVDPYRKVDLRSVQKMLKPYTEGKRITVTIKLEYLGRYSDTAPYNCEKSKNLLRKGIKALYESNDPGKGYLGILCLLAADDPTNPDNDKYQARAKEWVYKMAENGVGGGPWWSGPKLIVLSEYYMKTKDKKIFELLVKQAEYHARGVSWFGTTGHKWADKKPDGSDGGRLSGYGPINCSGLLGFLGLSLAKKAGVKSPVVDAAIDRQRKFFGHWAFRGGIHYGEMPYGLSSSPGDRNAVHALAALALGLQEGDAEKTKYYDKKAKYFVSMTAFAGFQNRGYAHGGPFFGQVWQPIGSAQGGVKTANTRFKTIRWHLDLKRHYDHSRIHDPTNNKYKGFCNSATALLFYALPLKQLYVTGRGQRESLKFSDKEFNSVLAVKNFDATKATNQELIDDLGKAWGLFRGSATNELAERLKAKPDDPESAAVIDKLLALAADTTASPTARTGACRTLQVLKKKSGDVESPIDQKIVKTMVGLLKDPVAYVRFGGVRVLQAFNPNFSQVAVKPYANEIMDDIVATGRPTFPFDEEDPCQWAHGEMGSLLFGTVFAKDLDGVDRKKLFAAIRSVLKTPNASARNRSSRILDKLSKEDVLQVADVIIDNIKVPPPANAMGGSAAPRCQAVLAKHMFEEGLPLCLEYGARTAMKNKIPEQYGRAGLSMHSSRKMVKDLGKQRLVDCSVDSYEILEAMNKAPGPEELAKLKQIKEIKAKNPTLTLPADQTELTLDAVNYADLKYKSTTYTWRKVYGAGKVSFKPNMSGKSKKTTVSFVDKKPGTYRFEVVMSDALGYSELRKTVDVILYDKNGKLPANKPPKAISKNYKIFAGRRGGITLNGTDPDGDDLGFVVTQQPTHGRLSGVGSKRIYTADFGYNGMDQFTFEAIDGQGKTATGVVKFKVSDKDVGVAAYEGFDYPDPVIVGNEGGTSFGFAGPWKKNDGKPAPKSYLVNKEPTKGLDGNPSYTYASLPSTGGKMWKGERFRHIERALDPEVLATHKLLEKGHELWFSIFVEPQTSGNNWVWFRFAAGEESLGIRIKGGNCVLGASHNGDFAGTGANRGNKLRYELGKPNMLIGHFIWAKTDEEDDTFEIYRVFNTSEFGPLVLDEPACVYKVAFPQNKITKVQLFSEKFVDEIRIGPTLHSVMVGTKPLKK